MALAKKSWWLTCQYNSARIRAKFMFSAHFISSKCDEYVSAPLGWEPCFLQGKFTQQSLGHPSSLENILSERTGLPPSMQLISVKLCACPSFVLGVIPSEFLSNTTKQMSQSKHLSPGRGDAVRSQTFQPHGPTDCMCFCMSQAGSLLVSAPVWGYHCSLCFSAHLMNSKHNDDVYFQSPASCICIRIQKFMHMSVSDHTGLIFI